MNQKIVDILNKDRADELSAIVQYMKHHYEATGMESPEIIDLAKTIAPNAKIKIVGIRPGEKFHEVLIGEDEARHTRDVGSYFVVEPEFNWWGAQVKNRRGTRLKAGFSYKSNNNSQWLTSSYINKLLRQLTENNV